MVRKIYIPKEAGMASGGYGVELLNNTPTYFEEQQALAFHPGNGRGKHYQIGSRRNENNGRAFYLQKIEGGLLREGACYLYSNYSGEETPPRSALKDIRNYFIYVEGDIGIYWDKNNQTGIWEVKSGCILRNLVEYEVKADVEKNL